MIARPPLPPRTAGDVVTADVPMPPDAQFIRNSDGNDLIVLPINTFAPLLICAYRTASDEDAALRNLIIHSGAGFRGRKAPKSLHYCFRLIKSDKRHSQGAWRAFYEATSNLVRPETSPLMDETRLWTWKDSAAVTAAALSDKDEDVGTRHVVQREAGKLALSLEDWDRIDAGESPIKIIRERRGLTQAALAKAINATQSYLSKLESGRAEGTRAVWIGLADTLDCTVDDLLGRG